MTTGGREMDMPAPTFGEPVADQSGLVRGVVVQMHIETARSVLDLVDKRAELCGTLTGTAFANDLARRNVERREERGRATARLVVAKLGRAGWLDAGHMAWLRSSAWILDYSSTHRMLGLGNVDTKSGALENLNV